MLNAAYDEGERPPEPEGGRVAAHADIALFFSCPDIDAGYHHLRAKGVDLDEPRLRDYGMRQMWLTDADGFRLCFQWPSA